MEGNKPDPLAATLPTFALGLGGAPEAGHPLCLSLHPLGWSLSAGPSSSPMLAPGHQDAGSNGQSAEPAPASPLPTLGSARRTRLN